MYKMMSLKLFKEDFKFAAAHFMIFSATEAERLHGHNYQLAVEIGFGSFPEGHVGYFHNFNWFKTIIRQELKNWDQRILLPQRHPEVKISEEGKGLCVDFRERHYAFPVDEVLLLPISNTSVEEMAGWWSQFLYKAFSSASIEYVEAEILETSGQGAVCRISSDAVTGV